MSAGTTLPPDGNPAIRVVAMPADTNANGDIFGGWLVSMMDLAAGTVASKRSKGRAATIAIDGMIFHRPVKVGDVVSVYADLLSVGRTSIKIEVAAWRQSRDGMEHERVTQATITFVAIDDQGRPRAVDG
ncbi:MULTISPECIES: acyl-CoA thioesterase [unclassified Sphingomonas]|uniref:acyl-CoA thioesterase n=1 Tax=unclassified Sphingomonas TaxID=196159 RepID=UPI0006FB4D9B|nr:MULTISPECIES: acyl-CoA thioesterase [unclassified Sphingomonas]KQX26225.1 acyl-CoA thioesterase [Sphingomonas sp. Root1294]KQY69292.1 acyl-CoA thioesterase [Sphingomonas sp. Root50]KRB89549.1 acyl-CoA thioesterase [Sphingomonas sp. Root720]